MNIHESAEDYLEKILMLQEKKGSVRSIDIAVAMGFSKPSVSVAMKNLRENGYISMDPDGFIKLEAPGMEIAQRIYGRHRAPAVQHPAQQAVILKKGQNAQHTDHAKAQKGGFVCAAPPGKAAAAQVGEHRQCNGDRQHGRHGQRIKHPRSSQQKHRLHAHRQMQVNGSHNHQKCTVLQALQPHERNLQT